MSQQQPLNFLTMHFLQMPLPLRRMSITEQRAQTHPRPNSLCRGARDEKYLNTLSHVLREGPT